MFGDINSPSVRDVNLYFVRGREREEEGEKRERNPEEEGLSHGKMCKGVGVLRQSGVYNFYRFRYMDP